MEKWDENDRLWRKVCAGSLLLACLSGNAYANDFLDSGKAVSSIAEQLANRKLKGMVVDTEYQYDLMNDYGAIFDDENEWCKESVFEVNFTEIGNSNYWDGKKNQGNTDVIMCGTRFMKDPRGIYTEGWGFAPVTKALNDAFLPGDPRKKATILRSGGNVPEAQGYYARVVKRAMGYLQEVFPDPPIGNRQIGWPSDTKSELLTDL